MKQKLIGLGRFLYHSTPGFLVICALASICVISGIVQERAPFFWFASLISSWFIAAYWIGLLLFLIFGGGWRSNVVEHPGEGIDPKTADELIDAFQAAATENENGIEQQSAVDMTHAEIARHGLSKSTETKSSSNGFLVISFNDIAPCDQEKVREFFKLLKEEMDGTPPTKD